MATTGDSIGPWTPSIASAGWAPRLFALGRTAYAAVVGCPQLGPVPPSRRNIAGKPIQQDVGLLLDQQRLPVLGVQEALSDHLVDKCPQAVEVAVDVQQATGLAVQAEPAPAPHLEQLLHGADPTGQREERIRQLSHEGLALMQVLDDVQLSQATMGNFAVNELLGDDPDDTSTRLQHGVGELAHKTDVAAAVDKADPALGK